VERNKDEVTGALRWDVIPEFNNVKIKGITHGDKKRKTRK